MCRSLFLNKVASLRPPMLLKKRLWHECFPVNFAKFSRAPIFMSPLRWLILYLLDITELGYSLPNIHVKIQ